jgi:hypothetical protein
MVNLLTYYLTKDYVTTLKVTALNLWEASHYPLTSRFPASRPPDGLSPFAANRFYIATQSRGEEGWGEDGR